MNISAFQKLLVENLIKKTHDFQVEANFFNAILMSTIYFQNFKTVSFKMGKYYLKIDSRRVFFKNTVIIFSSYCLT
jgi:hypothetical protein